MKAPKKGDKYIWAPPGQLPVSGGVVKRVSTSGLWAEVEWPGLGVKRYTLPLSLFFFKVDD
jgi:hypothetical protein